MKAGLKKLGAGDDIMRFRRLRDARSRQFVNKETLLEEFDELSQVMVSELEYELANGWCP